MGLPFLMANLAFFAAFVYCLLLRWEVEIRRAHGHAREEEAAGEGAWS